MNKEGMEFLAINKSNLRYGNFSVYKECIIEGEI
jgi:hypothetical protein